MSNRIFSTLSPEFADTSKMLRHGQILQLTAIAMLGLGVVMIHSAGMSVGGNSFTDLRMLLTSRHVWYAGIAICIMLMAARLDVRGIFGHRGWTNPLWYLVAGSLIAVALTQVPGVGKTVNGATRWLYLGPRSFGLSFQPSELLKLTIVLALSAWCWRRAGSMNRFWDGLLPPVLLLGAACALIVLEDLGTAVLLGLSGVLLLVAGGARIWQLLLFSPIAIGSAAYFVMSSSWRLSRLTAYADPWDASNKYTYHPVQSMIAIATGGVTGRGLGNGVQKFGYLPEDTTDFIFAVVCEEMGVAGAALVVMMFGVLIWSMLAVARNSKDTFSRLVVLGLMMTIGLQALINLMVVTVLIPTKGIALPLISAGGTGWIITAFSLGLVAAIDNANAMEAELEEEDEPMPRLVGARPLAASFYSANH